jgi:hypothetical protein
MGWFRSNSGKFAWMAFFALACQFALTFGHLHLSNVGVISAVPTASTDSTNGSTGQSSPAQQTPTRLAQDFCAVCNNISLANAVVLPASPAPVSPTSMTRRLSWPLAGLECRSSVHFPYNARGPPTPARPRPERLHRRRRRLIAPFSS